MKNIYNHISILLMLCCAFSCEVANDLDSFEPEFVLDAENAIKDANSAESALTGIYAVMWSPTLSSVAVANVRMGITVSSLFGPDEFDVNNPSVDNGTVAQFYTISYDVINRCNWVIDRVSQLSDSDGFTGNRRMEIIAEAKFFRALFNFYLLRRYGQFYDLDSEYGIVLKTTPSLESVAEPRSTVGQSYDLILSDLDDAIANVAPTTDPYYVGTSLAKGMKAKVLLYMGDFDAAADLAKEVIDNTSDIFELEQIYQNIFVEDFNSKEVLYAPFSRTPDQAILTGVQYTFAFSASPSFFEIAENATVIGGFPFPHDNLAVPIARTNYMRLPLGAFGDKIGKFLNFGDQVDTQFHLRLAEVYLIHAEAEARKTGGNIIEALGSLNTIRLRGLAIPYPPLVTKEQLLELVRIEKIIELAVEGGEEFFDMIRYENLDETGAFKVVDQKSVASDPNKYIWPIPRVSVEVSNGLVKQNPGY
ncbi:RagB/SusD family nutrient uptake outer membrane protein [Allomuricauda sp. SCSIO 65647]|uniref:RagB/SusD family nutrient uptake outer membrane protein n=1 Tax=Allomuricauda sp. SCSIO 65647 TaxID=2908843 RepID=UPI001F33D559|nr:RagB/SusD family nutrient uptake outer membrane protein [Muricauda sp. SCSIO 65647]UJH67041.1 RagB/SusD family nutrient uptake outer membrane protein [Muricauda sp. SCSIO 65647]